MKICIPTEDDRGLESRAFGHFGSAPFFTLVDVDNGQLEVLRNSGCQHGRHGHRGHQGQNSRHSHHVRQFKSHDVDAVLCNGVGRRAFAALDEAGIGIFSASGSTVSDIIERVRAGETVRLSPDQACGGRHHGGHHGPRH
jgi:predicted Fe-Mo cluster-binding NifX family protein